MLSTPNLCHNVVSFTTEYHYDFFRSAHFYSAIRMQQWFTWSWIKLLDPEKIRESFVYLSVCLSSLSLSLT